LENGKYGWKKPVGKPRCACEHNITTYIKEIGFENVDFIHLVQDMAQWLELVKKDKFLDSTELVHIFN
jgi:hypothetical protein